ncbi:MAG: superoxide dismutase family protein [Planctomycetales bacterium]|nr:superoxide dismutase family protein [Planctomycetales bacterium]
MVNDSIANWLPTRQWTTIWQYARKTILFVSLVGLLAVLVGSPNIEPTTTTLTPAALSESTTEQPTVSEPANAKRPRAISVIRPVGDSGVSGTLHLVKIGDEVEIRGVIEGLTPGEHGFHIHEFGDLSDAKAGKSAGGHFNPTNQQHGRRDAKERHVGDLGNIEADKNGKANISIRDSVIRLDGPNSIIGRSIVIHADADKFTQPAGDAGARVAFGVIGIAGSQ